MEWIEDLLIGDESADEDEYAAEDGCSVEPDGICPHGKRSPLLRLGLI